MGRSRPPQSSTIRRAPALLALAIGAALLSSAHAQTTVPGPLDGRDFAGIDIAATPETGSVRLAGRRVWSWQVGRTSRLLLDRDARFALGRYELLADRAVIWIEPVSIDGAPASQVAAYLENASVPGGGLTLEQSGPRLLVTGVIMGDDVRLRADLIHQGRPQDEDLFVREAEHRFARFLASSLGEDPDLLIPPMEGEGGPDAFAFSTIDRGVPVVEGPKLPGWAAKDDRPEMPPAERTPIRLGDEGVVVFSAGQIEALGLLGGSENRAVLLSGGMSLQYSRATDEGGRTVQLSAERAAVFLTPESEPGMAQYQLREVKGVYLEGDVVAQADSYTLRGSRIYYDIRTERAVVLDAVFWTYDEDAGMPLYIRADSIRQESDRQWKAKEVRLANVGFAEPHFAIGATEVTITQRPSADRLGPSVPVVDAEDVRFYAGDTPLLGLPRVRGEVRASPLRRFDVGSRSGDAIVSTGWDLYTILGLDAADGNDAILMVDGYFNRGPAGGLDLSWRIPDILGSLYAWGIYDNGTDQLPSGSQVRHNDQFRGVVEGEQIWKLSEAWTLFLEGAYTSDETFLPAFYPAEIRVRREFTNAAYARYLDERSVFSVQARYNFNDFTPNDYLLQSLGYNTQKLPELMYARVGDSLFNGLVSYTSEYRYSAMQLNFTEPTAAQLGYKTVSDARRALGLAPDQSIAEELRAEGLSENQVNRFDTRHEVSVPLAAGPINIVPFAVGRFTIWDDDFAEFNNGALDDDYRLWGSAGVRFATTIQRIDDGVRSEFFDLHRIRHIVEPSATLWVAGSTVPEDDLPIYDDNVESIARGTSVRLGVRNTWQTQRGGAGQRRSVDWLIIDTNYVWSSESTDSEGPIGRFIEARPEGSIFGEFIANDLLMQLTDAVAISNTIIYDLDKNDMARLTVGALFDHGLGFTSFVDYRTTDALSTSLLDAGVRYELTRKYAAWAEGTYDFEVNRFQDIGVGVERRFPQVVVEAEFSYDTIADEFSFGFSFRPIGVGGATHQRVFTRDLFDPDREIVDPTGGDRMNTGPFTSR